MLAVNTPRPMKTKKLLFILTVLGTLAVCAETVIHVPDTVNFWLDGQSYLARIKRDAVLAGPAWDTSKPLPLSFARAEQAARAELRKVVTDEAAWRVRSFQLTHLPNSSSWYYSVNLSPGGKREKKTTGFTVFIDSTGKAGTIEPGSLE